MGRSEKRKLDKMMKKRLTDAQYEDCKQETINERVKQEIDKFLGNFIVVFREAMKEYRISDERTDNIIYTLSEKSKLRYAAGEVGESRPNDFRIEADKFEEVATRVIESYKDTPPDALAKILYQEIMKAGSEV